MSDFVVVSRDYPRLAQLLVEQAPSFEGSPEFRGLGPSDLEIPSVVCGAFRRFVEHAHLQGPQEEATEAARAMEWMASNSDPEIENYLIVDVFEHLELEGSALDAFLARLLPASRALYERWIEPST